MKMTDDRNYARILAVALCLLPLVCSACSEQPVTAEQPPISVKVKTVEMGSANGGSRYSANIIPQSQIDVSFKVGGYVDQILKMRGVDGRMRDLQEGDAVLRETVIARVRTNDYESKVNQAQAQLAEAQSALEPSRAQAAEAEAARQHAKLEFDRAAKLYESQSLTQPDYDAARARMEMTQAKAEAAKAQIQVINARIKIAQTMLADAALPLQDTALKAPMNAVVLQRLVETGSLVSPGKVGFVLADTTSVKAVFGVPDVTVSQLKLGGMLTVTTEAVPGIQFHGQITRISSAADPKSRVFEIEVTIPNPRQLLKAGLVASLELGEAGPQKQVAVVPLAAILRFNNGAGSYDRASDNYAVYVVEEQSGKQWARRRRVKLGEALGNTIAVSEGIEAGERVIAVGATLVRDGQEVQVIP